MNKFRKTVICLFAIIVLGHSDQNLLPDSLSPLYANYGGLDLLSETPWVVNINDPIPFFSFIKDCNQFVHLEFYCLAVYDISDGIKYFEGGEEIVPSLDTFIRYTLDSTIQEIRYPPLKPNANIGWSWTPNQVFYEDWQDMNFSSPPDLKTLNWWKREITTFKHVGSKWDNYNLNGTPITPGVLGYEPGDTITFRAIIVCREIYYDYQDYKWYLTADLMEHDLRVIVVSEQNPLPRIANWFLTDCHSHSWNTDDFWEYGGVTPFIAKAAEKIGLDCVLLTDHSNDCGWVQNHNDGWGVGENWEHCGWEVNQYADVLLIRGEEISGHKIGGGRHAIGDERHFLGFGLSSFIQGWHPWFPTYPGALYDVDAIMSGYPNNNPPNNITAQNGFSYMAHPATYYLSDDYGHDSTTLLDALKHSVCRGLQIFNCRKTHESSSEMLPWGEFPHGQTWETTYINWFDEYVPIIRIWDRYMSKHLDSLRKKIFVLGGSDAHGDLNYSFGRGSSFPSFPVNAASTALGCWRTAVYCSGGLTRNNILNGIKYGRTVVTDGPMMIFGLDMNNDGDIYDAGDIMIGDGDNNEDGNIDFKALLFGACADSGSGGLLNPTSRLNFHFQWQSSSLFGSVDSIVLFQGTKNTEDSPIRLAKFEPTNGQQGIKDSLIYWWHWVVDSLNTYFRAVAYSHYGSGTQAGQIYRCFTNPFWVKGYFETPPANLHIVWFDESSVRITWEWTYGWVPEAWKILRREFSSPWPFVWDTIGTAIGYGIRDYTDNTVERDKKYVYRVVAAKGTTRSKHSNSAVVQVPLLNAPYHELRVHSPASNRINVQYLDKSEYETSFEIWRKSPVNNEDWQIVHEPGPAQSGNWIPWDDYDVDPEETYIYRVRAYTSEEPAGHSLFTGAYGATVVPHLKTSRDSATAFQPKVLYDANNQVYHMTYALESLLVASRSTDGISWDGMVSACYWGQEMYEKDAGFCQLDVKDDGLPVMVFSYRNRKRFYPNPIWYSTIHFAYYDPDSNDWIDSIQLYTGQSDLDNPPPFYPFTFKLVGDTLHYVFILDNSAIYKGYDYVADKFGTPQNLGEGTALCCPVMERDDAGNLYLAWYKDLSTNEGDIVICYRERINKIWSPIEEIIVPWPDFPPWIELLNDILQLSLKRINNQTFILNTVAGLVNENYIDHSLAYSQKVGGSWQTNWAFADTTASNGQLLSENLILYSLKVNDNWDIYYQEKTASGWSEPIRVKNTSARSKFPQGVFDGTNIALIWTEGDAALYIIDTAKVRVIPELEITYPTAGLILGERLRTSLPIEIKWNSSDNVGVVLHKVFYSIDNGITYTQIDGDLSGTTHQLNWTVLDTIVNTLKIKVEAYDGANMVCVQEVGPFSTTREFVFNPNFEEVSENQPHLWTNYGTGDLFEADWQQVQNGQFSAHIERSTVDQHFGFYQEAVPVEPNKKYWLQGYIKTQSTSGFANLAFGVWSSDPNKNHHRDFGNISGNPDWTYVCDSLTTRSYEDTIRIMMFGNPSFVGDAWFDNLNLLIDTIPPQVIVSYPNGGESLLVNEQIQIYWYTTDNTKMGKIDSVLFSDDAGQTWNTIATNLPANTSSCEWTVPAFGDQYKIRVVASDASSNRARDESDFCFGTKCFTYSGFELFDPAGLDNIVVGVQGVNDYGSERFYCPTPPNGIYPHTSDWMYKIWGTDVSNDQNSYVIFKVFPYDFIVQDSTYLSFWLWIDEAPTDSGHICLDAVTKDGQILRAWNKYGYILDQTGQRIHPGSHSAPKGDWYQYVFTFNPAVCETISELHLIYDDYAYTETGYFEGYIDDVEILDSFPISNCWHVEKFPVGSPYNNTDNYDPNFSMNFISQGDSTKLIIDPQGDGGEGAHWVAPTPGIRNNITDIPVGIPINGGTMVYWEQFDKDHSLILGLLVHDNQGEDRWLHYAKNAFNHWSNQGWVDMGDSIPHYNTWEWFYRSVYNDYTAEYGITPEYVKELRLEHFAKSEWTGDHGGTIKNLFIGIDDQPPIVMVSKPNGGEKLEIGSTYPITWNASDTLQIGLQSIYYSTNAGSTWNNVIEDQQIEPVASYVYNWQVPSHPSDNCLVKVVSKDIANNAGYDVSNNPFSICWLTSSDSTATAGKGENIVHDQVMLHAIFTSGDSIFYSYSVNDGTSWLPKQFIDFGQYPALCIDALHNLHLVYKKGNSLYYKQINDVEEPVPIYSSSRIIQSISVVVNNNQAHLAFEEREYQGIDPVSHIMYGYFNLDTPANFTTDEVIYDIVEYLKTPQLVVYADNTPLIIYERAGVIKYLYKQQAGGFTDPVTLGNGTSPSISLAGEVIDVVWQNSGEIYHRKKWYYSDFGPVENISNTANRISKDPVVIAPNLILWLEEPGILPDTRYDLVMSIWQRSGWSEPIVVNQNSELVFAPKACLTNDKLYSLFTYGNYGPYGVKSVCTPMAMVFPYQTTETKLATASNNAKRILLDESNTLHTFYQAGGYLFYTYDNKDQIIAEGKYPACAYDQSLIHMLWISGSAYPSHNLTYRKGIGETWEDPQIIWTSPGNPNYRILAPSFALSAESGFVAIEEEKIIGSMLYWKLFYLAFPLADPQAAATILLDSAAVNQSQFPQEEEPVSPSIVLDDNHNPHIVWSDKTNHICYTYWDGTAFVPKRDLTFGYVGEINARRPCLEKYRNRLSVVFELFNDIYFTYRILTPVPSPYFDWAPLTNISNSSDSSMAPIILCGSQVFYGEKTSNNWQIYKTSYNGFNWTAPENISNTIPSNAYYVQGMNEPPATGKSSRSLDTPIHLVWTGGYENEYRLEFTQLIGNVPNWQHGGITQNTTWQGDVFVTGDIIVNRDIILTAQPGTDVYVAYPDDRMAGNDEQYCEITVKGTFNVLGNSEDSVRIIPYPDTLIAIMNQTWYGIAIGPTANAKFDYCHVKRGINGIAFNSSSGLIKNTLIDSNACGIVIEDKSDVTIKQSIIRENEGMGLSCSESHIIIDSNTFYRNSVVEDTIVWNFKKHKSDAIQSGIRSYKIPVPKATALKNIKFHGQKDSLPFSCTGMVISNSQIEITNNRIIDNFRGIYTSGRVTGKVNNNLFDSNLFHGFDFFGDSFDIEIKSNTFTNNGFYPWPITELAGIYQGWFAYRPRTKIIIDKNTFQENKVGLSIVKYTTNFSEQVTTQVLGNSIRYNELGINAGADMNASFEAIFTGNTIIENLTYEILHQNSYSVLINCGNLDNSSTLDEGRNKIFGESQYAFRNETPFEVMAQGNFWFYNDPILIDAHIYDDDENHAYGKVNFDHYSTWGEIPPGGVWEGVVNIGGDVVVPDDVTLTIVPGTEIRFSAGSDGSQGGIDSLKSEMIVYGDIETGYPGAKVLANNNNQTELIEKEQRRCEPYVHFTSDAYEPEPGDWYGIRFMTDKKREVQKWWVDYATNGIEVPLSKNFEIKDSRIDFCVDCGIDFGGKKIETKECTLSSNQTGIKISAISFMAKELVLFNNNTGMNIANSDGTIKNNALFNNDTGLVITIAQNDIDVKENTVRENGIGIFITEEQGMTLDGKCDNQIKIKHENVFEHNALYHIYNNSPDSIDARDNYWYPAEPESIAYYIYDYFDDPNLGIVYYDPVAGRFCGGPQGNESTIESFRIIFGSNPAHNITIQYHLVSRQEVAITVYDVCGRVMAQENRLQQPGKYHCAFKNLASGVYFLKFDASDFELNRKVIIVQ